jgi:hypothetical protein
MTDTRDPSEAAVAAARQPKCPDCGAKATVEIRDRFNATKGRYCRRHGEERVAEHNARRA